MNDDGTGEKIEEVPGHALRVGDRLLWARRVFVIRSVRTGNEGVAWLTLAEVGPGFVRENAMELPVVLSCGDYRRLATGRGTHVSAMGRRQRQHGADLARCFRGAAGGDVVSNVETVARADRLWPDELFQHNGRLLQAVRVAVTPGEPVRITAREIDGAGGEVRVSVAAGELLRMVPT